MAAHEPIAHPPPAYIQPSKLRYDKRAEWHDYSSRCYYMVTVSRNDSWKEPFSMITDNGAGPDGRLVARTELTKAGLIIFRNIYGAMRHFNTVEIKACVIMPDHFHFVIFIKEKTELKLWNVVNYIKSKSTSEIRESITEFADRRISPFKPRYNDRIVLRQGMLDRLIRYVQDNPRRLLMRRRNSNLFRKTHILVNGDLQLMAFGNMNLLKDPFRSALIVSSRYTPEERIRHEREWEATASGRGVFVSPFISPHEKRLMETYLSRGARMIKIVEHGFWERFKPQGKEFELCAAGRLLLIGEMDDRLRKATLSREMALSLNERARILATIGEDGWRIKKL